MGEEVIGYFTTKITLCECDRHMLFFTSERVIVARLAGVEGLIGAPASGIAGSIVEEDRADREDKKAEYIKELSAESILESDESNFAIPYENITRVEMKRKGGLFSGSWIIFTIDNNEKMLKFILIEDKLFDQSVELVRAVISEKLVVT